MHDHSFASSSVVVVISPCSFHLIEGKIASYRVAQFIYTQHSIPHITGVEVPCIQSL